MIARNITILAVVCMATLAFAQAKKPAAFYCKYCGHKASSVASLTASACIRHPAGPLPLCRISDILLHCKSA